MLFKVIVYFWALCFRNFIYIVWSAFWGWKVFMWLEVLLEVMGQLGQVGSPVSLRHWFQIAPFNSKSIYPLNRLASQSLLFCSLLLLGTVFLCVSLFYVSDRIECSLTALKEGVVGVERSPIQYSETLGSWNMVLLVTLTPHLGHLRSIKTIVKWKCVTFFQLLGRLLLL